MGTLTPLHPGRISSTRREKEGLGRSEKDTKQALRTAGQGVVRCSQGSPSVPKMTRRFDEFSPRTRHFGVADCAVYGRVMSSSPAFSPLHPFYDPLASWDGCRETSAGPLQGTEPGLFSLAEPKRDDGKPASGSHQQELDKVAQDLELLARNAKRCA